jgi:hypothetical protein
MRFSVLFSSLSFVVSVFGVVDFGVQGKQYEIVEINGNKLIKDAIAALDVKKIEKELEQSFVNSATSNVKIKVSYSDENITTLDVYKAKWDIRDVDGSMLYRTGEPIPTALPFGVKIVLCFVDGSLQKKIVDKIVASYGKRCKYFVNKVDVRLFSKEYGVEAYPLGGQNLEYIQRYKIGSLPTKMTRFEDKIKYETLSVKRMLLEAE